jgi:hypothetical protein
MQLEWITEVNLLENTDEVPDALSGFDLNFRRNIARQVINYLTKSEYELRTIEEAKWCMSAIGQVFNLPSYIDVDLMNEAFNIYIKWLLEKNSRPICFQFNEDESLLQKFLQVSIILDS